MTSQSRMSAAEFRKLTDEHQIQKAIVAYLDRTLPPYVRVVAVANKPRSAIQGALEKERGSRKGFPDLFLIKEGGVCGLLEVKKDGGRLSPEQREWRTWCSEHAIPYAVVRSQDDVKETLVEWGILRRAP